jgi:restriction system protein
VKFRMAENSLFAILLRSSWWISFGIAAFVIGLSLVALPPQYAIYGAAGLAPFLVIAAIVGVRTLRAPSAARVAATEQAVRAMSWGDFSAALEEAFRQDGFTVTRRSSGEVDFEMSKGWKRVLVSAKRWKVARTGVEPLRTVHAALESLEAHECLYVTVGEVTESAVKFAVDHRIRLVQGPELARLLPRVGRGPVRPTTATRG